MYCWNCGKEMEDDLLFCPHCAMKQAGIPEPKPKRKNPVFPIACTLVCIVVLLGMILLLTMSGGRMTSEPVDLYSVELPDLASFLNTQYTQDDVSTYTHYVTCVLTRDPERKTVEEIVDLLLDEKYQLVLDSSRDHTEGKNLVTDYIFHYTGKNEAIDWIYHRKGYQYHVKLSVYRVPGQDRVKLVLYVEPDFVLTDPGMDAKTIK